MINLPEWLENELKAQYNDEIVEQIKQGFESERKTTFRVNTIKSNDQEIIEELESNQIKYKIINKNLVENVQTPTIFVLENDIEIRKTKIYNEGKIYIQNLSSMIPALFLNPIYWIWQQRLEAKLHKWQQCPIIKQILQHVKETQ